ncbi:hydroxymethylglutaryl-CoA reductase, degradative [Candidatus Woesearchaeota archaeon]|nr:hydroxymethylglutaryl-CoA reductase, degradative [Candidatus Woesearchaeota archaeon]
MKRSSHVSEFYSLPIKKRLETMKKFARLSKKDMDVLNHNSALDHKVADMMIENVIGTTQLPIGVAPHFRVNGRDYFVPMAIEESSVVAAASHAAKLARPVGFKAECSEPIMIGQIQLMGVKNVRKAQQKIHKNLRTIKHLANGKASMLVKLGGGIKGVETREIETERGKMLIVHILVDVRDAMGANAVNTYCEAIAPFLEDLTGGKAVLRIISNLATKRTVQAKAVWKKNVIGEKVIEGILDAYAFAKADPYRAATHNKGIMNAVDAVLIATSNDWRAAEAGCHAYASLSGKYQPLTHYWKTKNGDLAGMIEIPMPVGLVGGATRIHPVSQVVLKILDVKSVDELSCVIASAGLANNFAALRAMVSEGIRKGHMKLHATNIAHMAGAHGKEINIVAERMANENNISFSRAVELRKQVRRELTRKKLRKIIRKVKRIRRKKR